MLEVTSSVDDVDREVCAGGEEALGAGKGAAARFGFHHSCPLRDSLAPVVVWPIRGKFPTLIGRLARLLNLSDSQTRPVLLRARDFRPALKVLVVPILRVGANS